jgi:hypothetical protein
MSGIFKGAVPLEISVDDTGRVRMAQGEGQVITISVDQAEHLINWLHGYIEQTREAQAEE